jgi:hypothetical protein
MYSEAKISSEWRSESKFTFKRENDSILKVERINRVARFSNKIQIWVTLGGSCNGRSWYILWTLGLYCGQLVYVISIWYRVWSCGIFLVIWYMFGPLVYFLVIWYMFGPLVYFWSFGICLVLWYTFWSFGIFSPFWYVVPRSGNPDWAALSWLPKIFSFLNGGNYFCLYWRQHELPEQKDLSTTDEFNIEPLS